MSTPSLFKILTNFFILEFAKLCSLVCPIIVAHARSTGVVRVLLGCPSKLSPEHQMLGFFLNMKYDPTTALPSFLWNWSKSSVINNHVFIARLCISWALRDEIKWPDLMKRQALVSMVPGFPRCIGITDNTLVKIRRPWKNRDHGKCRALLLEECPQHHGHNGDPRVMPKTCAAIGERAQVILVWVRAPGHGNASHPQKLGVTRVRLRALNGSWRPDSKMLKNTSIRSMSKKL